MEKQKAQDNNLVYETSPLSGREYQELRQLFGLVSAMENGEKILEKRLRKIKNGWRNFRIIKTLSENMLKDVLLTIDPKKLAQIYRELKNIDVRVTTMRDISGRYKDGITYVQESDIQRLAERIMCIECFCCNKMGRDAVKCGLRRDLEALVNFDRSEGKEECPFREEF